MSNHHVTEVAFKKLGPSSWRLGVPFPRGGVILVKGFNAATWEPVHMNGVTGIDRQGARKGIFTYGLCGCLCCALVRMRNNAVERIVLHHYTTAARWKEMVKQFNAVGTGGPQEGDTVYLVVAEQGEGNWGPSVRDEIANAGQKVSEDHLHVYSRAPSTGHVSFGISLDRYAGEVPTEDVKNLPALTWARMLPI